MCPPCTFHPTPSLVGLSRWNIQAHVIHGFPSVWPTGNSGRIAETRDKVKECIPHRRLCVPQQKARVPPSCSPPQKCLSLVPKTSPNWRLPQANVLLRFPACPGPHLPNISLIYRLCLNDPNLGIHPFPFGMLHLSS